MDNLIMPRKLSEIFSDLLGERPDNIQRKLGNVLLNIIYILKKSGFVTPPMAVATAAVGIISKQVGINLHHSQGIYGSDEQKKNYKRLKWRDFPNFALQERKKLLHIVLAADCN